MLHFPLFFLVYAKFKGKNQDHEKCPRILSCPSLYGFANELFYFILFYFILFFFFLLFFKVCFLHSSNHHAHQMSILNLLSGFSSSEINSLSHHFDQEFPPQELWLVPCLPYVMFCFPISAEQTQTKPFSLFVVVP